MKKIIIENIRKIIKARKELEKALDIKIENHDKEINLEGSPEDEYIAEKIIEAMEIGFSAQKALLIKTEDFFYENLNIKHYTKRKDLKRIRARIIGANGKTLRLLTELTDCFFEIKENNIGIIGPPENVKNAHDAIILIIQGSKQANVYAFLEKHRVKPVLDLGLKEPKKKK